MAFSIIKYGTRTLPKFVFTFREIYQTTLLIRIFGSPSFMLLETLTLSLCQQQTIQPHRFETSIAQINIMRTLNNNQDYARGSSCLLKALEPQQTHGGTQIYMNNDDQVAL